MRPRHISLRRPWSLTIIGGLMTAWGGFLSMHMILQCVDTLRLGGWGLLAVHDGATLAGFFLYGLFPIGLYVCGTGMLIGYRWARLLAVIGVLPLGFFYSGHSAYRVLIGSLGQPLPFSVLYHLYPEIFMRYLFAYAVFALIAWLVLSSDSVRSFCHR